MHPIHPVSPKTHVWCVFAVSVSVTKTRAKPDPEGRSGYIRSEKICRWFFRIERTQSTPFDPKLMCGVFSQFRFRSPKLVRNLTRGPFRPRVERKKLQLTFFESNAPNPPRLTQNSSLVCFRSFGFGHQNSCETRPRGPFWLHKERKNLQMIFFRIERTQSTPFDPKLKSAVFSQFRFRSPKLVRHPTPRAVLAT